MIFVQLKLLMEEYNYMAHKYGIYQSSSKSCIFYKQDQDGRQSTFNIFISPKKPDKKVIAFIDNEQVQQKNWETNDESSIRDVLEAFGGWAADAPIVFELEAHKSINQCVSSIMKKEEE